MQRKLIALAVSGLVAVPAFAQSNVTIYGQLDAQYVHWSNDATAGWFNSPMGNGLGIMGEEDLGGGLKAFFKLEERFNIDDGSGKDLRWNEISFIGLKGKFGEAIFGRVPTALDTVYPDPGSGDTVGSGLERKAFAAGRATNAVRYTSPALGPVQVIAHYGLTETPSGSNLHEVYPYGIAASAKFGGAQIDAGWQRDTDLYKRWGVYGGYDFGVAKVGAGYGYGKSFTSDGGQGVAISKFDDTVSCTDKCTIKTYYLGGEMPVATGKFGATISRITGKDNGDKWDAKTRYGVSYWHNVSKRTQLVASVAYERQDDGYVDGADHSVGTQFGIRHKF